MHEPESQGDVGSDETRAPVETSISPSRSRKRLPGPGLLAALGWVVLLIVSQIVFVLMVAIPLMLSDAIVLFGAGVFGMFWTSLLIVGLIHGGAAWRILALHLPSRKHLAIVLVLSTPMVLVSGEAAAWIADLMRSTGMPESLLRVGDLQTLNDAIRNANPWLATAVVVVFGGILPGVGEELFFRGFLGRGLVARWGPYWGILLTSFLFGAMHLYPLHVAVTFLFGILLHVVYLWTRSLLAPMILHAAYNCQAIFGNAISHGTRYDLSADAHLPPLLAMSGLAVAVVLLALLYRSRVRWTIPDGSAWSPGFPSAEMPSERSDAVLESKPLGMKWVAVAVVLCLVLVAVFGWELARW